MSQWGGIGANQGTITEARWDGTKKLTFARYTEFKAENGSTAGRMVRFGRSPRPADKTHRCTWTRIPQKQPPERCRRRNQRARIVCSNARLSMSRGGK